MAEKDIIDRLFSERDLIDMEESAMNQTPRSLLVEEAAAEISRLRAALAPFARIAEHGMYGVVPPAHTAEDYTEVLCEMSHEEDAKVLASLNLPPREPMMARTKSMFSLDSLKIKHWLAALTAIKQ